MNSVERIDTFIVDLPAIQQPVLVMATTHSQRIVRLRIRTSDGVEGIGKGTRIEPFL